MERTKVKISRRGFRNAPASVKARAEHILDARLRDGALYEPRSALATLRPATYCGPGSAGARGAYVLDIHIQGYGLARPDHSISVIEAEVNEPA